MSNLPEGRSESLIRLWLLWFLITGLVASIAWIVINWLVFLYIAPDPKVALSDDNAVAALLMFGCGLFLIFGPLVGIAQGIAMRLAGWTEHWAWWILADTAGVIVTVVVVVGCGILTVGTGNGWIWVILPGSTLGSAQWIVVRAYSPGAIWWIPGSWAAWISAVLIGVSVRGLVHGFVTGTLGIQTKTFLDYPFYPSESAISWSVSWALSAFIFAALTGFVLIWLLRRPPNVTNSRREATS